MTALGEEPAVEVSEEPAVEVSVESFVDPRRVPYAACPWCARNPDGWTLLRDQNWA